MYSLSEEEFSKLAQRGNLVPVYGEFSAALETPLAGFLKIRRGSYGFLLESVERGQNVGRYSFIGSEPYLIFKAEDGRVTIQEQDKSREFVSTDPLQELEKILNKYQPVQVPGLPGFTGGAVGYFGYGMVRYFEKLPPRKAGETDFPDCLLLLTDSLIIFDHVRQVMQIVINVRVRDNPHLDYRAALKKIELIRNRLDDPVPARKISNTVQRQKNLNYTANVTAEQFQEMVKEAKNYIKAGEIFQVVLSQRMYINLETDPLEVYRALRSLNPSPYMFYLQLDDIQLVGSSPELLVKVEKEKVEVRPIAGTRPRGKDEVMEQELEKELLANEKERAEHLMLVDLGRNDLGRVSSYGSVKVENFMEVEKYSHVMHLVSRVKGHLLPHCTCFDVLRACFPAGTVSGAPKIRAMEIIDRLEPTPRGPYAGAVGYFSFTGDMDTCITIRTLVVKNGAAFIQTGAGIVADSDPLEEYIETQNKATALIKAVEMAVRGEA